MRRTGPIGSVALLAIGSPGNAGGQGPKTVKGAQSDPNNVSRLLLDCVAWGAQKLQLRHCIVWLRVWWHRTRNCVVVCRRSTPSHHCSLPPALSRHDYSSLRTTTSLCRSPRRRHAARPVPILTRSSSLSVSFVYPPLKDIKVAHTRLPHDS